MCRRRRGRTRPSHRPTPHRTVPTAHCLPPLQPRYHRARTQTLRATRPIRALVSCTALASLHSSRHRPRRRRRSESCERSRLPRRSCHLKLLTLVRRVCLRRLCSSPTKQCDNRFLKKNCDFPSDIENDKRNGDPSPRRCHDSHEVRRSGGTSLKGVRGCGKRKGCGGRRVRVCGA